MFEFLLVQFDIFIMYNHFYSLLFAYCFYTMIEKELTSKQMFLIILNTKKNQSILFLFVLFPLYSVSVQLFTYKKHILNESLMVFILFQIKNMVMTFWDRNFNISKLYAWDQYINFVFCTIVGILFFKCKQKF